MVKKTARKLDSNGWFEIQDNPISMEGVFPYFGSMIDPQGKMGLDPVKTYQVYRPASELSESRTIDSFKLLPWIDEHAMLGSTDDALTPLQEKGIEGITGEKVYFDDGCLYANLKLFSEDFEKEIDSTKPELSCGYRCTYHPEEGMYGDKEYSFIQKDIRGNHIASIPEGRMGPEVSVLDQMIFTIDRKDFKFMDDKENDDGQTEKTLDEYLSDDMSPEDIQKAMIMMAKELQGIQKVSAKDEDLKKEDPDAKEEDLKKEDPVVAKDNDDDEKEKIVAMDERLTSLSRDLKNYKTTGIKSFMREIQMRDALYGKISEVVGTFDHSEMTIDEVATYACNQIGLKVPTGHEVSAINAFAHNRPTPHAFSMDTGKVGAMKSSSSKKSDLVNKYFQGS